MNKKVIDTVFQAQLDTFKKNIAVVEKDREVTFETLFETVNQMVYVLHEEGVQQGDIVGVYMKSSADYIATILAINKLGAVFLPIEINYPTKRNEFILSQAAPTLIVTQESELASLQSLAANINEPVHEVLFERSANASKVEMQGLPELTGDEASYLVYTSGSTGTPKAILGVLKGLSHFVHWQQKEFKLNEKVRTCQLAPLSFDVSLRDIFLPLLTGGAVVIPDVSYKKNPEQLIRFIIEHKINTIHIVPSLLRAILKIVASDEELRVGLSATWKYLFSAGEALYGRDVQAVRSLLGTELNMVNLYGPSETTLAKMFYKIEDTVFQENQIVPLGYPIANAAIILLNAKNEQARVGELGEICIKTPFRSKGYYLDEAMTSERFIQNPLHNDFEDIIYRTGDFGKLFPDGIIHYAGRKDSLVKIRGNRVEISEVEKNVSDQPGVKESVVIPIKNKEGDIHLAAYVITEENFQVESLKELLKVQLPDYMIPTYVVHMEYFPVNLNGKIDKKSLPQPEESLYEVVKYVAPQTELEIQLSQQWKQVLGLSKIGIKNSFFDLGGHSLNATQLASKVKSELSLDLSIKDIFDHPTVEEQAVLLSSKQRVDELTIPRAKEKEAYVLSPAQMRFWLLHKMEGPNIAYNVPSSYRFNMGLQQEVFKKTLNLLVDRHEILRTSFREDSTGNVSQKIHTNTQQGFELEWIEAVEDEAGISEKATKFFQKPFDLNSEPLFRLQVLQLGVAETVVNISLHHIIADGWSNEVLLFELSTIYAALLENKTPELSPLEIQYKDYSEWVVDTAEKQEEARIYWTTVLQELPEGIDLPYSNPRPAEKTYNGGLKYYTWQGEKVAGLNTLLKEQGATLFMGLRMFLNALVYKYTGASRTVIGNPISGRNHTEFENQLGCYLNTLAIPSQLEAQNSWKQNLRNVKNDVLRAFEHQNYPFEKLTEDLKVLPNPSRSAMFDMMLVVHNQHSTQIGEVGEGTTGIVHQEIQGISSSKFDLNWSFVQTAENELMFSVNYNSDIYPEEAVDAYVQHLGQLLESAVQNFDRKISDSVLEEDQAKLSRIEGEQITWEHNTLLEKWEAEVQKHPEAKLTKVGVEWKTFQDLENDSNTFAFALLSKEITKDEQCIGLQLLPDYTWLVGLFGTLKAGKTFVPMNANLSEERRQSICTNAGVKVIVDKAMCSGWMQESTTNPELPKVDANDLAYILYTSGSTGSPKGVRVSHRALHNYVSAALVALNIDTEQHAFVFQDTIFDGAYTLPFLMLFTKGTLTFADLSNGFPIEEVDRIIREEGITCIKGTPSLFNALRAFTNNFDTWKSSSLKTVFLGGEQVFPDDVLALNRVLPYCSLINQYGPTETTVGCLYKKDIQKAFPKYQIEPSVGKPYPNVSVLIVDNDLNIVPNGVVGQLAIYGANISDGYVGHTEATNAVFIEHPKVPNGKVYLSGDYAYMNNEKDVVYCNRKDEQVKVRGYRIELGDIRKAIVDSNIVNAHAVVVEQVQDQNQLVVYYTADSDLDIDSVVQKLSDRIPEFMVPYQWNRLIEIPYTPSGKLDKKALALSSRFTEEKNTVKELPQGELENLLAEAWSKVIGVSQVYRNDNFFHVGGDSIKAIQIIARLRQKGYRLKVTDLMGIPEFSTQASKIDLLLREVDQSEVVGNIPLGAIQSAYLNDKRGDKHHYNQSLAFVSEERFSVELLNKVLVTIMTHHDALRMVFKEQENKWLQYNNVVESNYEITSYDLKEALDGEAEMEKRANEEQAKFSLENGPLFKMVLFQLAEYDQLLLTAHHLVVDGISWRILMEDIFNLYIAYANNESIELPKKTDSFAHWMKQMNAWANKENFDSELSYWEAVAQKVSVEIQPDFEEGKNTWEVASSEDFSLDSKYTDLLNGRINEVRNTQVQDLLLTALSNALIKIFGVDIPSITLESHGREPFSDDVDVSRTVGWFTSKYPVVFEGLKDAGRLDQIESVKDTLRSVPSTIGYGILDQMLNKIASKNTPQVLFNYLGDFGKGESTEEVESGPGFGMSNNHKGKEHAPTRDRNALLEFNGLISGGQFSMAVTYSSEQFRESKIQKLMQLFKTELESIIDILAVQDSNQITIGDITYKKIDQEIFTNLKTKFPVEDIYPLSPLQLGIYFNWLKHPRAQHYFQQTSYRIESGIDLGMVKYVFEKLTDEYDVLKTVFVHEDCPEPLQILLQSRNSGYQELDYTGYDKKELEEQVIRFKEADRAKGFNLNSGPLVRLSILKIADTTIEFIWSHHHILMDGWCMGILVQRFNDIYRSLLTGNEPPKIPVNRYKHYISWLENINKEEGIDYWRTYLKGFDRSTSLLSEGFAGDDYVLAQSGLDFDFSQTDLIATFCRKSGVTVSTFVQTAWGILLAKYNNLNDVVFGLVVSGRQADVKGIEHMVGLFINTIPVRVDFNEEQSVVHLLQRMQNKSIASDPYHFLQLSEIQEAAEVKGTLFDHILVFENFPLQEHIEKEFNDSNQMSITGVSSSEKFEQTNFNLDLSIVHDETLRIGFSYNEVHYSSDFIQEVVTDLEALMLQMISEKEITLQHLKLNSATVLQKDDVTAEEKQILLEKYVATTSDYPKDQTLVSLFERVVSEYGNQTAVIFENTTLSYAELNRLSNELGRYLQAEYTIGSGDLVGIELKRSERLIVGILGILKSGGAYVPIDVDYPEDRKSFIRKDSGCKVVLTDELLDAFYNSGANKNYAGENLGQIPQPEDLCYVIYTSGTTGTPKGVMVQHNSVVNYIHSAQQTFKLSEHDTLLQQASISFDISVEEIFTSLISGSRMVILKKGAQDFEELLEAIAAYTVTVLSTTPYIVAILNQHTDKLSSLRMLVSGGDQLWGRNVENLIDKVTVLNTYGPTEATVCATYNQVKSVETAHLIGKPLPNTRIYILDAFNELQPIGVSGELCISGAGLARGYLNRPDLTAEKFIMNPYQPEERMYKTGDVARWLPDGNIEFIGRVDDQVKIRGYRIELGEIENALQNHEEISQSAVLVKTDASGRKELVGYFVSSTAYTVQDIRNYLKSRLPDYMIPGYFVQLESLPLTVNGKIDKKHLLELFYQKEKETRTIQETTNETQKILISIWEDVLHKKNISIYDNYYDLGGHSLKALEMFMKISKVFGKSIKLENVLSNPTIQELSVVIDELKESNPGAEDYLLVPFNKISKEKETILMLPPALGTSLLYLPMTSFLSSEFNLLGMNVPGLFDKKPQAKSIQSLAKQVIAFLTQSFVSKKERVIIMGYSFGVRLVYEMARQMEAEGYKLELVMIDSGPVHAQNPENDFDWNDVQLQKGLHDYFDKVLGDFSLDIDAETVAAVTKNNHMLFDEYVVEGKVSSKIIAFESEYHIGASTMLDWENYTTGKFSHHWMKGGHNEILSADNIPLFIEKLLAALEEELTT
ncbi:MAG: amino acid adenylation domain-containing protein [Fluviicola sp.]